MTSLIHNLPFLAVPALWFALSPPALAQPKPAAFDVVSIQPCPPGTRASPMEHTGMMQMTFPGGRFQARAISLAYLIEWAYGILPAQRVGGPSWLDTDRYDIAATSEGNPTTTQMKLMVRTMLADRFHLNHHLEKRTITAYVLTKGKRAPKLTAPQEGETPDIRFGPRPQTDQKFPPVHLIGTRFTMADLAQVFGRRLEYPVIDKTGLAGQYNFEIDLVPDEARPNPLDPAVLLEALRDQLGFAVKSGKTSVDVLVITAAEKVAAGNP